MSLSECRTWSHAVISSLGARARGGWSGASVMCRTLSDPVRGQGLMGSVGSRPVLLGYVRVLYGSVIYSVYQSYTDTGQLSDPSRPVGSSRPILGSDRFPSDPLTGVDGSLDCPVSMYGPIRDPTASPRALQGPVGIQRTPSGPPAAPSDPA